MSRSKGNVQAHMAVSFLARAKPPPPRPRWRAGKTRKNFLILKWARAEFLFNKERAFFRGAAAAIGLPIGNLTSQLFANIYLNELDRFIKHALKEKYYIRYTEKGKRGYDRKREKDRFRRETYHKLASL